MLFVAKGTTLANHADFLTDCVRGFGPAVSEDDDHEYSNSERASEIANKDKAPVAKDTADCDAGPLIDQRHWHNCEHAS